LIYQIHIFSLLFSYYNRLFRTISNNFNLVIEHHQSYFLIYLLRNIVFHLTFQSYFYTLLSSKFLRILLTEIYNILFLFLIFLFIHHRLYQIQFFQLTFQHPFPVLLQMSNQLRILQFHHLTHRSWIIHTKYYRIFFFLLFLLKLLLYIFHYKQSIIFLQLLFVMLFLYFDLVSFTTHFAVPNIVYYFAIDIQHCPTFFTNYQFLLNQLLMFRNTIKRNFTNIGVWIYHFILTATILLHFFIYNSTIPLNIFYLHSLVLHLLCLHFLSLLRLVFLKTTEQSFNKPWFLFPFFLVLLFLLFWFLDICYVWRR